MDEINVMKKVSDCNNPHILKMIGCVTSTHPMMVVLQFVPHGNLKDYLKAQRAVVKVRDAIVMPTIIQTTSLAIITSEPPIHIENTAQL